MAMALLLTSLPSFSPALHAQPTNSAGTTKKESPKTAPKKPSAGPFNGKLAAVNLQAKTIQVGKRTFQITSETKLYKDGKTAALADGTVGEAVSGYVKPTDDGKWLATTVNFGPKPSGKSPSEPAKKPGK
jgi:hypothetical protein